MVLPADEIRRRIVAARTLRGIDQTELGALMESDGLGKHDLGRIERGDIPMMAAHRRSIAHHLRVAEQWFTQEDIDELLLRPGGDPDLARVLAQAEENTQRLERMERVLASLEGIAGSIDEQLALRDASRAVTGSLADRLDSDAEDAATGPGTRDAEDATRESGRARRAGNS